MSVRIEVTAETGADAAFQLRQFFGGLDAPKHANADAPQETVKSVKGKKTGGTVDPLPPVVQVEQPNGTAAEQVQMFPETEPAKAEPTAEKTAEVIDEAACRAALQHLHSVHAGKKDSPGGIKAAQAICAQFSVKKVSELKPEQWAPFHAACMAQALEVQKS